LNKRWERREEETKRAKALKNAKVIFMHKNWCRIKNIPLIGDESVRESCACVSEMG
jgi:hypothetical protein